MGYLLLKCSVLSQLKDALKATIKDYLTKKARNKKNDH